MIPSAKAEIITGTLAAAASVGWTSEILPVISEIGIVAGTLVALHGVGKIAYGYYRLWKYRQKDNH